MKGKDKEERGGNESHSGKGKDGCRSCRSVAVKENDGNGPTIRFDVPDGRDNRCA